MTSNTAKFDKNDLIVLFSDRIRFSIGESFLINGVSTDTRNLKEGNLFVALKGENFDGNSMVLKSFESGAGAALIDEEYYNNNFDELKNFNIITSPDTLSDFGRLAAYHRTRYDIPIIAVAGSNGKTTTKEMTAEVLSQKYKLLKTEGNYNNRIGVPHTLLQLDSSYSAALIEIGTNEPGEIAILSSMVHPTAGLITNIGREHLEKLIDLDGVEMEETFLFGHLRKHNGTAFINSNDERLIKYAAFLDKAVTYGIDTDSDVKAQISITKNLNPVLKLKSNTGSVDIQINAIGFAAGYNALAAAAVGIQMQIPIEKIKHALENFRQDTGHGYARMVKEQIKDVTILNDCYNANPDSMRMALLTFEHLKTDGKKYPVLGDMREMGESSASEHLSLLTEASQKFDKILITGDEMLKANEQLADDSVLAFSDKKELTDYLKNILQPGDSILVKGSRGMKMEEVIEFLKDN